MRLKHLVLMLASLHVASRVAFCAATDQTALARDRQIVLGMSQLSLDAFSHAPPERAWVVARIVPRGERPESHNDGSGPGILARDGVVTVDGVLSGDLVMRGWPYREEWQEESSLRSGPPRYNPFRQDGGSAILLVHPTNEAVVVEETYLLPAGWQDWTKAAMEYFRAHEREFRPPTEEDDRKRLLDLVSDPNPVLAIAASGLLAATRHRSLLDKIGTQTGDNVRGPRLAALIYIALHAGPNIPPVDAASSLGELIERAATPEDLHGVALGLFVARTGGGPTVTRLALLGVPAPNVITQLILADRIEPTLWPQIRRRQIAARGAGDTYLNTIFADVDPLTMDR